MTMRTQRFDQIAARLKAATDSIAKWAPVVQGIADDQPESVPPETVRGVQRPVEAVALARDEQGIDATLRATRAAMMQAVLQAERAIHHAACADRRFRGE